MNVKDVLSNIMEQLENTKIAVWDMRVYSNKFVLVLDENIKIRFINLSLAKLLGFENEKEAVGKSWLDFIPDTERQTIKKVHVMIKEDESGHLFAEYINRIVTLKNEMIDIKWFNTRINHKYEWTFSFGVILEQPQVVNEQSIRDYYLDIIKKDRTAIVAIRDKLLNDSDDICKFAL